MMVFVFPGQGSQKRGMGQGLFDTVKEYAAVEREVDALLGYSMRRLCLEDSGSQLALTQFTQPALFIVNALHYFQALSAGQRPEYLAGHSLGEYNALMAAGAFDLITGVRLVAKRGELMAQARNGGMMAVVGIAADAIQRVLNGENLHSIDIANLNSPAQTVLSGPTEDLRRASPLLERAGASMCVPLSVSAAFHSRYMADAAREFESFLTTVHFSRPVVPTVCNVTGLPYPSDADSAEIRSSLVKQITHSVKWVQSIQFLRSLGNVEFRELGPGNVLTRLIQQIR